jgi:phage FluMu protein Com
MNKMSNTMIKSIPYFWIAFYNDDTCLPQFDLDTGKNYLFKEIDQSKLVKYGWFPITSKLAEILKGSFYYNPKLYPTILELKSNQRLIALREESQSLFSYTHCIKCGFDWQWMVGKEDGSIGNSGLPRYGEKYCYHITNQNGKEIYEVICPKCGAKNDFKCPKCDKWWNKIDEQYTLQCPECKDIYEKKILIISGHRIECRWLLGYQETLPDGNNSKCIMSIDKNGIIQLKNGNDFK